ncbi:MAG: DUF4390 domain-containing protein [Desulfobacterales bacterium]|nr:DUF4390 domain-containing protein [Desulfobacterales bacterium]
MIPSIKKFFLISIIIFSYTFTFAQDAKLTNIIVTNTADDLLIYLNVEGAFKDEMEKAILSGVSATFSFLIKLDRIRSFFPDKEVVDIKVSHAIKYNSLKKEFIVTRSWENNKPFITSSFKDAQKFISEINGLRIVPVYMLEKGRQYQISVKAELSKVKLPLYLHYIFFFVSLWDFETDWYTIDFVY